MAISIKRYVDITSSSQPQLATGRDFSGLILTNSELALIGTPMAFSSASGVGARFGLQSEEYEFASKYFSFTSKDATKPKKLSFAGYSSGVALRSYAIVPLPPLADIVAASGKQLVVADNKQGEDGETASPNTSGVTSYASFVAALEIFDQVEIKMIGTSFLGISTVSENTYVSGPFADALGWTTGQTNSPKDLIGGPLSGIQKVDANTDDFGSFCFLQNTLPDEAESVAEWNTGLNNKYLFVLNRSTAVASNWVGTHLVLGNPIDCYRPMAIGASVNFSRVNAMPNWMFHAFAADEYQVGSDEVANLWDAVHINYLGLTKQAGRPIQFYQRGFNADGTDVAVYWAEMWLKDRCAVACLNLLLALRRLPANNVGAQYVENAIVDKLVAATENGVILTGKVLTDLNKTVIYSLTNDENAWRSVQDNGYWLNVVVSEPTPNEFIISYVLIYSKGDSIRKVEGAHVAI